jgi:hypothetical protein
MPGAVTARGARPRPRAALIAGAVAALAAAAVLGWALWGGSGEPGGYPPGPVPGAQDPPASATRPGATAPGATVPGGTVPGGTARPGITGGTETGGPGAAGFLAELGAIDPALTADPAGALAGGRAICQDLAARRPDETVLGNAAKHFRLGAAPADRARTALIVDAAHNHLCP